MLKLVLLLLLHTITNNAISSSCQLEPIYHPLIDQFMSPFTNGITPQMIAQAQKIPTTCLVTIRNNKLLPNECLSSHHSIFIGSIAHQLPDLSFVLSDEDLPLIRKYACK